VNDNLLLAIITGVETNIGCLWGQFCLALHKSFLEFIRHVPVPG